MDNIMPLSLEQHFSNNPSLIAASECNSDADCLGGLICCSGRFFVSEDGKMVKKFTQVCQTTGVCEAHTKGSNDTILIITLVVLLVLTCLLLGYCIYKRREDNNIFAHDVTVSIADDSLVPPPEPAL